MKAILITGAASGIGRATAKLFAARGWRVGLADIDARGLAETLGMLGEGPHTTHRLDVRARAEWDAVLGDFAGADGLDVLHNNAGVAAGGPLATVEPDAVERVIAVNFVGVVHGARAAYPFLKRSPGSCLLNTASASAIYGSAGLALYSATKFAVRGLTEALDGEWAAEGIRVRSLMPGFIDTPLLDVAVAGTTGTARDTVAAAGMEFTPVERVAEAAWDAVHGDRLHTPVGRTARRMTWAARWMPGLLRRRMRARG